MKVQGGGFLRQVAAEARLKEKTLARDLGERFKGALGRGEPKELGGLLKEIKALSVSAERQFLAAALGTAGKAGSRDAGAFRDLVMSALSPEQRRALACEIFPLQGLKGRLMAATGSLEAKLAKFLADVGGASARILATPKDAMTSASHAGVFGTATAVAAVPAQEPSPELQVEIDRVRAEMAKKQV